MQKHTQLDYPHIPYGDASLSENGCACCVMASLAGKAPEEIARCWGDRYWDDDFGTLPEALHRSEEDLGVRLDEIVGAHDVAFHIGDAYVLLAEDDEGKHYELLHVRADAIERQDPRHHGVEHLSPCDARRLIARAERAWSRCGSGSDAAREGK